MIFVHVNVADEKHSKFLNQFDITIEECPTYAILEIDTYEKFSPSPDKARDLSVSSISEFVNDYFENNTKRTEKLISAELPANWDTKPVKVLVSSNFKEVVMDQSKHVFVAFYTTSCGKFINFKV